MARVLDQQGSRLGSSDEVLTLQKRIKSIIQKDTSLTNVIQVMLVRRTLPCQQRSFVLWEFDSAQHQTLQELYGMMHEDV